MITILSICAGVAFFAAWATELVKLFQLDTAGKGRYVGWLIPHFSCL